MLARASGGEFEAYVQDQLLAGEKQCCILAGPVLAKIDPSADFGARPIQYPVKFWKVIAVVNNSKGKRKLATYGFVFDQSDVVKTFGIEFTPGVFGRYQKKLSEITVLTGVVFDSSLLDAHAKKPSCRGTRNAARRRQVRVSLRCFAAGAGG